MKRLSNYFKLTETIVPFSVFLRDEVELSTLRYTCNYHLLFFLWFLLFSIFFGLEKGHTDVCYLVTLCLGNFWHIFVKKCYWDAAGTLNTAFRSCSILPFLQTFLLGFFKTECCTFYIYQCIRRFLIHNFTNSGIADNQR